jgi:hypothetical protein
VSGETVAGLSDLYALAVHDAFVPPGWDTHVVSINRLAEIATTIAARQCPTRTRQADADRAGLSEDERRDLHGAARCTDAGLPCIPGITACELIVTVERILAARQRPTRQADTDRAVVEAVEALADEWTELGTTSVYESAAELAQILREHIATAKEAS